MIRVEEQYLLKELFQDFNSENLKYKIEFNYLEPIIDPYIELASTMSCSLNCVIKITNLITNESITAPLYLMELPLKGSMGLKIDGTNYEYCSINDRASGWYNVHTRDSSGKRLTSLELRPASGRNLVMVYNNGYFDVVFKSKKGGNRKINLAVFLKAISGLTYREILSYIGVRNRIISRTFVDEKSYEECVNAVLDVLIPSKGNVKSHELIPEKYRVSELKKFLGPTYIRLDKVARERYNRDSSFSYRALNLDLAISALGYPVGTKLTADILKEIDASDLDTLYVNKNGEMFELKKYKVDGVDLDIKEIFTEVNMLINNACGFNLYAKTSDDIDRVILSLRDSVRKEIIDRLISVLDYINSFLMNENAKLTELNISNIPLDNPMSFINKCKQEFTNTQGAETTNIFSHLSKDQKVVMSYSGKTNSEMIEIKGSQQSMYDHYHIPESDKIGLVSHLTIASKIGEDGMVYSPFLVCNKGEVISKEPVYLNQRQREGKYIAPWDADLSKDKVRCYFKNDIVEVNRELVDLKEYTVLQNISVATSMIEVPQFSEGKRLLMGCNGFKQTYVCLASEAPLVSTGSMCLLPNQRNVVIRAIDILDSILQVNNLYGFIDTEKFMQGSIKLINLDSSTLGYRSYMFQTVFEGKTYNYKEVLPFCKIGTENSMFHYFLNYRAGHEYSGRDIVLYNNGIDIKKYNLDINVNLGSQEVDNRVFDFDHGAGCNFRIAFKSSGIPNMDDGIVISDSILGTGKLAHAKLVLISYELKNFKEGSREDFGVLKETAVFQKNGLPRIGSWLKPRSNVIGILKTKYNNGKSTDKLSEKSQMFETLGADVEGEVVAASRDGNIASVLLATISEIELGDKLAGSHGNKGVIGKIVPKKDMPYMEDGTIIEMTLNPLGIPSRMNISQSISSLLGFAAKRANKRYIISSFNPDTFKIIEDLMKKEPELGKVQLYDGRTGRPFERLTAIGDLYMKKLQHVVKGKMCNCGVAKNFNPITGQPNKGKSVSGGQTIGEMETWTMEACGLHNFMNEIFTIKSDDYNNRKNFLKCLEEGNTYTGKMVNSNIDYLQTFARMMGCELELVDDEYNLRPLLDKDIRGLSAMPQKNLKDALQDDNVYGDCKGPEGIQQGKKIYSYLELNCEIVHPIWIYKYNIPSLVIYSECIIDPKYKKEKIVKMVPSFLGKDKVRDIIDGKYFLEVNETYNTIKGSKDKTLLENPEVGITAIVKALKVAKLDKAIAFYKSIVNKIKEDECWKENKAKRERVFNLINKVSTAETLKSQGLDLKDLIITTFPVLPKPYRYSMDGRGSNFDIFYSRIMSVIKDPNVIKPTEVYMRILEFTGLDEKVKLSKDSNIKNWLEYATGKGTDNKSKGFGRLNALSHIAMFSGRSVIIPGDIPMGYVGLPRQAVYNIKSIELPNVFSKRLEIDGRRILNDPNLNINPLISALELGDFLKASEFFKSLNNNPNLDGLVIDDAIAESLVNKCDDIMRDLLSETAVAVGRQPTLHDESIQGLVPLMVEDNAIHLHPLLCGGFNADFDGDQMWYSFAHSPAAINELLTTGHPMNKIYSNKDGSVSLTPTQDILLGLYLMTMLHDNVLDISSSDKYSLENTYFYTSVHSLEYDVNAGYVNLKDLVCLKLDNNNKYLSTAGRILLNSVTPNGFTDKPFSNPLNIEGIRVEEYKDLMVDGLIRKSNDTIEYVRNGETLTYSCYAVNDFITKASAGLTNQDVMGLLDRIVSKGIESCVSSGITLHYSDFKDCNLAEVLKRKYEKFMEKRNKLYELGLLTDESKKQIALKATAFISKTIKDSIMNLYSRNDNLFIIMDSGARGNVAQVVRTTGILGTINKSSVEQIETPVLSCFKKGLSSSDVFIMANGTRQGVSDVQKGTGKVGEMTRALVFGLDGIKVKETDCGCGFVDIKVDYDECKTRTDDLLNKKLLKFSRVFLDTVNITKEGIINANVINYLTKHHIKEVHLEDGSVFTLEYKLSGLFRSMMINKLATDLPDLENNSVITKKTLDYIEDNQLESIKARTIITCDTVNGVCSKCYGVLFNGRKLPSVGRAVGITAAQSIGEPAIQLQLDSINQAGSGNSSADAVGLFKGLAAGSIPKAFKESVVSIGKGFVEVQDSGDFAILKAFDKKFKVSKSELTVVDGEKVFVGQELVKGIYNVNDIPEVDDFMFKRLYKLTGIYYDIFKSSGIDLDVRHFEILARAQQSYFFVTQSDDPNVPVGSIQNYKVITKSRKEGHTIDGFNRTLKKTEQIFAVSGSLAAVCHHDPAKSIAMASTNRTFKNKDDSLIGKLISGTNLVSGVKGKAVPPKFRSLGVIDDNAIEEDDVVEEIADTDVFSIVSDDLSEVAFDIDLSDFGMEDGLDNLDALDDLFDEAKSNSTVNAVKVKNSNVFSGLKDAEDELSTEIDVDFDSSSLDGLFDESSPNDNIGNVNSVSESSVFGNPNETLEDLSDEIFNSISEQLDSDISINDEDDSNLDELLDIVNDSNYDENFNDEIEIDLDLD